MTQTLQLSFLLHLRLDPAWDDAACETAWRDCFQPLLGALHHTPDVRVGLVLSGHLVEDLRERHPEGLEWIRVLLEREQIELIGTPVHEPITSLVPERDLVAQLKSHSTTLRKTFALRPTGAWLPWGAWDPCWPRVIAAAGFDYSFVPDRHIEAAGGRKGHVSGVFRTERDGDVIALLPVDERVAEVAGTVPVKTVLGHLQRRSQREHGPVNLAIEGNRFGASGTLDAPGANAWFATFIAALAKARGVVRTVTPAEAVQLGPNHGRIYLAPSVRSSMSVPVASTLVRYVEANRLHKKMLRVSRLTSKLRRLSTDENAERRPDPTRIQQIERYLHRAQDGAVYSHSGFGGATDPRRRALAWRDLIRAQLAAMRELRLHKRFIVERVDEDCDGIDEIVVTTPAGVMVVDPSLGGAVTELSLFEGHVNLADSFTRIVEPYHQALIDEDFSTAGGDDVGEADLTKTTQSADLLNATRLLKSKAAHVVDSMPRALFQDRFLDARVTLDALRRGTFPDASPTLNVDSWQVLAAERYGRDAVRCAVAADATVLSAEGEREVRVSKRYTFKAGGVLDVRHEVLNRSEDVLRCRVAVEINLSTMGEPRDGLGLVVGDRPRVLRDMTDDGDAQIARLNAGDMTTVISWDQPARVWHYPIETVEQAGDAWPRVVQGVCIVLIFPLELWGQEKSTATITIATETL